MKKRNYLSLSLSVTAIYIILELFINYYYNLHHNILECVHIIGPLCNCACPLVVNQDKIILVYKTAKIISFVLIFLGFIINLFVVFKSKRIKIVKIVSLLSSIIFGILILGFFVTVFS